MKKNKWSNLFFLLGFALLFTACGGNAEEKAAEKAREESQQSMEEAAQEMEQAAEKMRDALSGNEGSAQPTVDWRKLQDLLPEKMAGLPRTNESGETAGVMGFNFSQTEGTYEKDDRRIDLSIMDTGGMGVLIASAAAWSSVTIDREDRDGYERTTTIDGYKAFEKYNKTNEQGEVSVIVGSRFVVTAQGRNIKADDLRDALDEVNLKKLERME
jgi:hypothetical protein